MQVILQFCLIAILLEEAFSSGVCYDHYACMKVDNHDWKIPDDNPKVKGERENAGDIWYKYVHWLDKPVGNLTVAHRKWYQEPDTKAWIQEAGGDLNVYAEGKLERFEWTKYVRKALGLNNPNLEIPRKVRVDRNLLSKDKCIGINFESPRTIGRVYFMNLLVTDAAGAVYLRGHIKVHE